MTILHVHSSFNAPPPPWFKGKLETRRDPASVTTWCWHQTDVAGGFGAADLQARCIRYAGTSHEKSGVPYHYVYSPQDDAVIALWHPRLYSWHGNGANSFSIGMAIDGKYPGDMLDLHSLGMAFELAIEHARLRRFRPALLDGHRQHSDGRGNDPGAEVWPTLEIVGSEVEVVASITRTTGSGSPIPDSWRPKTTPPVVPPPSVGIMPTLDVWAASVGDVRTVQGLLTARGHDPGVVDGVWGPRSDSALAGFLIERELVAGSMVTGDVWHALLTP